MRAKINKLFYVYKPPRSIDEIDLELQTLKEKIIKGMDEI